MRHIVIAIALFLGYWTHAQTWQVNPADFSQSMNITAQVRVDGQYSDHLQDQLGAFVNGECRGFAKPIKIDEGGERYIYFLTIFSNFPAGESLEFRFHDYESDQEIILLNEVDYSADGIMGSIDQPYLFYTNHFPTALYLSETAVNENEASGTKVAELTTEDLDENQEHTYQLLPFGDASEFYLKNNSLYTNTEFDFETKHDYSIMLGSDDGHGGSISDTFSILIENVNDAPVLENLTDTIDENLPQGAQVLVIKASDQDRDNELFYEILPGEHSDAFEINMEDGGISVNNERFLDFERYPELSIQVRVTDDGEPMMSDVAEVHFVLRDDPENVLKAARIVTPNGDGVNDTWVIEDFRKYRDFQLTIFNAEQKAVYQVSDYQNNWSGTYRGLILPEGVYYYVFHNPYTDQQFSGSLSIIH